MSLPSLHIGGLTAKVPIIQGGMAVRISMAKLAAAVANEGGIGLIAASGIKPPELIENIQAARKMSDGIIGINVMVAVREFANLVQAAIKEGIDLIVAGAGFSRDAFKWCAEAKAPFVPIISEERGAKMAERLGASAVILEGKEAGGHLGTGKRGLESTWDVLPRIIGAVSVPVIAAGGILVGKDIAKALDMGASGVQIGSRFAVSDESNAAIEWKQACVDAKPEDVVLVESPVGMPARALSNEFAKRIEDMNSEKVKTRCVRCLKECKKNYCIIDALEKARQGDLKNGLIFCGERIGEIKEILPVKEIFKRLIKEYELAENPVITYG
ncbi:MAG: nitronate monooxygenase [Actinobacteria bacterium]|nr:nitronate monooxygenase [Actinomycetota bacterium]